MTRRINMRIEVWDRQPLRDREAFVGRTKGAGAPLSGGDELTEPDFSMPGSDGPLIPRDSHIRVVHPTFNNGARMLRRGYSFVDGSDPLGSLEAGLFFIAFVRNPDTNFIPIQNTMATSDAMMEYLKVTGSTLFPPSPPGIAEDEYVGQALSSWSHRSAVITNNAGLVLVPLVGDAPVLHAETGASPPGTPSCRCG